MALLQLPLGTDTVFVEIEDQPGAQPISLLTDRTTHLMKGLDASLFGIRELATRITAQLCEALPNGPDEIELSFGIKASGELNALVVAKLQTEANFAVKLKWVRHKAES